MKNNFLALCVERYVFPLTLAFCFFPYIGILIYLRVGMHATTELAATPSGWFLGILALLGILVPTFGLITIIRRLIQERKNFKLNLLIQAYISLILIFASSFALLHVSSVTPSFSAVPLVWEASKEASFSVHMNRLHETFFDALYLSVITITTVGYGDMTPLTPLAKISTALESVVGIGFMGIALGHYFSVCVHRNK